MFIKQTGQSNRGGVWHKSEDSSSALKVSMSIALVFRYHISLMVSDGLDSLGSHKIVQWSDRKQPEMGVVDTKESDSRVIIRSSVLPERCVGVVTCRFSDIDSIRSRNSTESELSGSSTWMFMSPVIMRGSVVSTIDSR